MRLPREQRLGASAGVADKRVVHDIFISDPGVLGKLLNRWPRVHQPRKRDGLPEILILFACAHHLTGALRGPDFGPLAQDALAALVVTQRAPTEKTGDPLQLGSNLKTTRGDRKSPQALFVVAVAHLENCHGPAHF